MKFEGRITKMGRKRIINVPTKQKDFVAGDNVKVIKIKKVKE